MPIEFQPPSLNLQGFQIPAPQSTDPLQTLAQMGQLRTQGLQQQTAQMGLEQERQNLDSQKALMQIMADTKPGETFQQTIARATASGKVLPTHLKQMGDASLEWQKSLDALDENKRKRMAAGISTLRPLYEGVTDQTSLDTANQAAVERGVPQELLFKLPYTDPTHLTAHVKSLIPVEEGIKESQEKAATAASQATEAKEKILATEGQQKVDVGEKAATIAELQAAPQGPDGMPTPAAAKAIQLKHPKIILPTTKQEMARFVRSGVPPEKQPEYDLNQRINELGMFGKDQWDQFLYQNAKTFQNPDGTPKAPGQVTPQEYNTIKQKWAEYTADPVIRALAIGQKTGQEKLVQGQLASMPTPESIDTFAKMAINHEMSPDQWNELRSGRTAAAPQIIMRAKQIDPNFNPARLEAEYKAMTKAEADFGTGAKGDLVRSNNNTIEHMGQLDLARQALGTGNIPLMRSIAQSFGVASGGDAATTYDLIAKKVGDEFTKSFVPGAGGEKERMEAAADFRRQLGDKQISGNIKAAIHAMDVQQQNLIQQYNRSTYGKGTLGSTLMTPEALATRDRLLGKKPAAGGLQYVKHAMGPNNHEIGQTADGKWHDVQTGTVIQ